MSTPIVNDASFSCAIGSALASAGVPVPATAHINGFLAALAPYDGFAFQIPEGGGMGLCNPAAAFLLECGVRELVVYFDGKFGKTFAIDREGTSIAIDWVETRWMRWRDPSASDPLMQQMQRMQQQVDDLALARDLAMAQDLVIRDRDAARRLQDSDMRNAQLISDHLLAFHLHNAQGNAAAQMARDHELAVRLAGA
jgi:hypothetical protein